MSPLDWVGVSVAGVVFWVLGAGVLRRYMPNAKHKRMGVGDGCWPECEACAWNVAAWAWPITIPAMFAVGFIQIVYSLGKGERPWLLEDPENTPPDSASGDTPMAPADREKYDRVAPLIAKDLAEWLRVVLVERGGKHTPARARQAAMIEAMHALTDLGTKHHGPGKTHWGMEFEQDVGGRSESRGEFTIITLTGVLEDPRSFPANTPEAAILGTLETEDDDGT